jgi:hypothetical protein
MVRKRSRPAKQEPEPRIKRKNGLLWLFEPFEDDPGFVKARMFGFDTAYLDGKLYLAVRDGSNSGTERDEWDGLLVCTSREHHDALRGEYPELVPHKILGKWLYMPQGHPAFENVARGIVELAAGRDPRLGVEASTRGKKTRLK